ncbi:MAG TPA: nuclear transport factor 2 family protein [Solirubrobacter sp.]|nr:nuclear transport factor 2 family protein [Solirubrobacter sp.]
MRWVAAVCVAVAGCGGAAAEQPAMSADERAIRETLAQYVAAVRANDPAAVCRLTAGEVIEQIEAFGTSCESVLGRQVRAGGPRYRLTTTSVSVRGNRAMTRGRAVESDGPRSGDQPLVREGGRWLLTTNP